ncbi:BZIP domain-containing protein [Entamoeba marina]
MEGHTATHHESSISQDDGTLGFPYQTSNVKNETSFSLPQQFSPYHTFSPYIPQTVTFPNQQPPQFPNVSQPQYSDPTYTPLHRRKRKFQNITYDKLLSEEDLASMTVEEFEDYVNELKDRRTVTKAEKATLNKIKRKLKNKESARKSRQKSKEAFLGLQEQLQELRKQYDEVLRINCQLIEIADGCDRCRQRIRQVQPQRSQGMIEQHNQALHAYP